MLSMAYRIWEWKQLQNSIDDGENEDAGREDCSVIGSNVGVAVTEFNIDHKRCAGVVLSENETRQVSVL